MKFTDLIRAIKFKYYAIESASQYFQYTLGYIDIHGFKQFMKEHIDTFNNRNTPYCVEQSDKSKCWYIGDTIRHREYGPAIEYPNGNKAWYIHGIEILPEKAVNNEHFKKKYPELVKSMIIDQVHKS